MTQIALKLQRDAGYRVGVFADVKPNPVAANVEAGSRYFAGGHDGVIAFGGGSGLDAGKAIAFMAGQNRPMWDFEDIGDWWTRADPRASPDHRRADHRRHRLGSGPRRASSSTRRPTPRR